MSAGELRFHLLGPVRAERGGRPLALGPPQQRAALAVLLLRGGRAVSTGELVDALWGQEPPPRAVGALRTYISRLRAVLEPERAARTPGKLLLSAGDGYALRAPEGAVDSARFEAALAQAASAREQGAFSRAYGLLRDGLALWEGAALAGLPGPYAERERDRLGELRLSAREELYGCALELGLHADAVAALRALAAEHPLRERPRALLMLALHRSGRQAEALAVYDDTRRLLAEELGVDPGSGLRRLHARVLSGDTGLSAAPHTERPAPAPPAQLPPDTADFTGREELSGRLAGWLTDGTGALAVAQLTGLGGAGKTALAVHVAHAVRDAFADGQLYADLRGADPAPAAPGGVLAHFLRSLGQDDGTLPQGTEERAARYRSALAGRRVLVLLDNAHDAAQLRPLLPGAPGCAVLVTCRSRALTLPGARVLDVGVLQEAEAVALLAAVAGQDRVAREPAAARELAAACGHLPLAVRVVAARLAARPARSLASLAARLRDERGRLAELHIGDLAVEPAFRLGYRALPAGLARAFRLLALPDSPVLDADAARAVLDTGPAAAEQALEDLVDAGLLDTYGPDRYRFHDLVRLFARQRGEESDTATDRDAVLLRLLDHQLSRAVSALNLLEPEDAAVHGPASGPVPFPDEAAARAWAPAAHPSLLASVGQVLACVPEHGLRPAVDLLAAWAQLTLGTALHQDLDPLLRRALEAARGGGDDVAAARALRLLAAPHYGSDTFERAQGVLRQSLHLAESAGDAVTRTLARQELGVVLLAMGRPGEALPLLTASCEGFAELGAAGRAVRALSHTARAHIALAHPGPGGTADERAARAQHTACALEATAGAVHRARALGRAETLAHVLYQAGCTQLRAQLPDAAAPSLREALALFERADSGPRWPALAWARLAHCRVAQGRHRDAVDCADRSLAAESELGDAFCRGLAQYARGHALLRLGETASGRDWLLEALAVLEGRGAREEAAEVTALLAAGAANAR